MRTFLSLLVTGSKLGALLCFSAMGAFVSPVMAEFVPSCHQVQKIQEAPDKSVIRSNNCSACEVSQDIWSNPFVQSSFELATKKKFSENHFDCPWKNIQTEYNKNTPSTVAMTHPPDLADCPCRQHKEQKTVQLRL
jgi:hypothetical protein